MREIEQDRKALANNQMAEDYLGRVADKCCTARRIQSGGGLTRCCRGYGTLTLQCDAAHRIYSGSDIYTYGRI